MMETVIIMNIKLAMMMMMKMMMVVKVRMMRTAKDMRRTKGKIEAWVAMLVKVIMRTMKKVVVAAVV